MGLFALFPHAQDDGGGLFLYLGLIIGPPRLKLRRLVQAHTALSVSQVAGKRIEHFRARYQVFRPDIHAPACLAGLVQLFSDAELFRHGVRTFAHHLREYFGVDVNDVLPLLSHAHKVRQSLRRRLAHLHRLSRPDDVRHVPRKLMGLGGGGGVLPLPGHHAYGPIQRRAAHVEQHARPEPDRALIHQLPPVVRLSCCVVSYEPLPDFFRTLKRAALYDVVEPPFPVQALPAEG